MYALKPPKVGGVDQLRLFVDDLGFSRACTVIDVSPTTMRRWLAGKSEPPQAAMQALYWLTRWGFSNAFAEAHWAHQALLHHVRELEAALAWRAPERQAANEPTFTEPPHAGMAAPWWFREERAISF
jgi:hypothetical protein